MRVLTPRLGSQAQGRDSQLCFEAARTLAGKCFLAESLSSANDLFEKSRHLARSGFVATLRFRGAVTRPATLSKFFSGTLSVAGALVQNVRAQRKKFSFSR